MTLKSFLLRPEPTPGRHFNQHMSDSWQRIRELEPEMVMNPWDESRDLPTHSLPALEAAKCAQLQGDAAFRSMDGLLWMAYYERQLDISDRGVLIELAGEAGLDVARFTKDFDTGWQRAKVLSEDSEARKRYGITSIPTTVFDDWKAIVGAVPMEQYRSLLDSMLP